MGRRMGTCVIARPPRHYTVLLYLYCVSNRLAMNLYLTVCPVDFIVLPIPGGCRRKVTQTVIAYERRVSVCSGVRACQAARSTKYNSRRHLNRYWRGFLVSHTSEWRNIIVSSTGLLPIRRYLSTPINGGYLLSSLNSAFRGYLSQVSVHCHLSASHVQHIPFLGIIPCYPQRSKFPFRLNIKDKLNII